MGNTTASANALRRCPVCKDLQPNGQDSEPYQVNFENLRDKCGYCQLLRSAAAQVFHRQLHRVFVQSDEGEPIRLTYFHEGAEEVPDDPSHIVELIMYSHEKSRLIPGLGILGSYPKSTDLDASIDFISKQLETCLAEHAMCSIRHESTLPTRVLSIASSDPDVRLVESKGLQARYVTLSHCWGKKQPMKTLSSNIAEMRKAINLHDLPVVFQQAISVARMLQVEYIWIDSLCIIQDSQSDWEHEAAQMCDYYENSFLTISTAASSDSTIPFLTRRDDVWDPVKLELATSEGTEFIYAQRVAKTLAQKGKLFSRAWTWQESALSTRTIYFTPFEPIWECLTQVVPQRYIPDLDSSDVLGFSKLVSALRPEVLEFNANPSNFNPTQHTGVHSMQADDDDGTSTNSDCSTRVTPPRLAPEASRPSSSGSSSFGSSDMDMTDYIWEMWNDLVAYYSRRELTFATDKLPALSGVASRVHKATHSRYLAGMWEENLAHDLCWSRADFGEEDLLSLPTAYVAPSWSWASTPAGVEFRVERTVDTFDSGFIIVEAFCHVPGLNPFGRVSAGHLTLRGRVTELVLTCTNPKRGVFYTLSGSRDKWRFFPDSALISGSGNISRATGDQELSDFRVKAFCLYLGFSYTSLSTQGANKKDHYMMVLGNLAGEDGVFSRVGLATSEGNSLFAGSREQEVKLL